MRNNQLSILIPALLPTLLAAAACSESIAPSASVVSTTPDSLLASDDALDDLVITVEYSDGDGDLGGGTAQIHDCRGEGLRTELMIPAIAPDAVVGKPITGTLALHVNDVGEIAAATPPEICRELGAGSVDKTHVVFCVVLVDAAGHAGDGDCTTEITLATE